MPKIFETIFFKGATSNTHIYKSAFGRKRASRDFSPDGRLLLANVQIEMASELRGISAVDGKHLGGMGCNPLGGQSQQTMLVDNLLIRPYSWRGLLTWRIIPSSKCLITMVGKSPFSRVVGPSTWPLDSL